MNKDKTKEAIKIMQAFVDGKNIECMDFDGHAFKDTSEPAWNFGLNTYRIKPEPQYVPFTENDYELFLGKPIKRHGSSCYSIITNFWHDGIYFGDDSVDYETLVKYCHFKELKDGKFVDGTPCGKLVQ